MLYCIYLTDTSGPVAGGGINGGVGYSIGGICGTGREGGGGDGPNCKTGIKCGF